MANNKNPNSRALLNGTEIPTDEYMKRVQQLTELETGERTEAPAWLKKIGDESRAHTENVLASKVEHPDPDEVDFDNLDLDALNALGFTGKVSSQDLMESLGVTRRIVLGKTFDPVLYARGRGRKGRRNRGNQGGNQGNQGGKQGAQGGGKKPKGGGGRALPKPSDVDTVVSQYLTGLSDVGMEGDLVIGEFNMEFLDAAKVKLFQQTYEKIVKKFHIIGCVEVDSGGLQAIANAVPEYTAYTSVANTRNQAVGFLVHKRFKVLSVKSIDAVANVSGVPDLRPAYCLELEDLTSGAVFTVVVVHLKSMRGGPAQTGPVRYKQCQILANALGKDFSGIILGDFNTFLNNSPDYAPLINAGFKLLNPTSTAGTHSMKSRLDGYFFMSLPHKLGKYGNRQIWANQVFGRGFSDHSLLSALMLICGAKGETNPACDGDGGDEFSEDASGDGVVEPKS
ncbi:MAG: hypothetical protein IAF58_18555 [Leptolyngbya sp.]|nr:hypothetical protein [Candidatus Melainabacteria bacterium]